MNKLRNSSLKKNAQTLRKEMTKEERHLWYDFFKVTGIQAHRQKPIGPYIVDFYIASANLVVELDGSQHYEDAGKTHDAVRDAFLKEQGLTVLRYANSDVNRDFRGVCEDILQHLSGKKHLIRHPACGNNTSSVIRLADATPHPSSGLRGTPDATFPSRGRLYKED